MSAETNEIEAALRALVERQRTRCLWYLREDYFPTTIEEKLRLLDAIERHGDREAFLESARIREWYSAHSSAGSAGS